MHSSTYKSAAEKISSIRGKKDIVYLNLMNFYEKKKIEERVLKNTEENLRYRSINNKCRKIYPDFIKINERISEYFKNWRTLAEYIFRLEWSPNNKLLELENVDSLHEVITTLIDANIVEDYMVDSNIGKEIDFFEELPFDFDRGNGTMI